MNAINSGIVSQRNQNALQLNGRENHLVVGLKQTPLAHQCELGGGTTSDRDA